MIESKANETQCFSYQTSVQALTLLPLKSLELCLLWLLCEQNCGNEFAIQG
jgi:hypothetical protein